MNAYLRQLKAQGAILGGKLLGRSGLNRRQSIQDGKIYFNFDFTPPYPAGTSSSARTWSMTIPRGDSVMAIELPRLEEHEPLCRRRGYAGRIDEIQPPKLTLKTEEHRAGRHGPAGRDRPRYGKARSRADHRRPRPGGLQALRLLDNAADTQITIRGAIQAQGREARPVIVNLRGGWKELDAGAWKPATKAPSKVSVAPATTKLTIDDEEEFVEIDAINLVRKVGGTDQMEAIRAAIGL